MLDKIIHIPEGDLLIHAGDATGRGTMEELIRFNRQLADIKHKFKFGVVFVPGNHDFIFQREPTLAKELMTNAMVLIDEQIDINGLKIYGSPWTPYFHNWAFNLFRGEELKRKWDMIPRNTDVLITHGPPHGYGDKLDEYGSEPGINVGCEDLLNAIDEIRPQLHVFGHIHENYGMYQRNDTTLINASSCTSDYKPINDPIIYEIR